MHLVEHRERCRSPLCRCTLPVRRVLKVIASGPFDVVKTRAFLTRPDVQAPAASASGAPQQAAVRCAAGLRVHAFDRGRALPSGASGEDGLIAVLIVLQVVRGTGVRIYTECKEIKLTEVSENFVCL